MAKMVDGKIKYGKGPPVETVVFVKHEAPDGHVGCSSMRRGWWGNAVAKMGVQ